MFQGIGEVPQQAKQHGSAYTGLCCFSKVRPHLPCLLMIPRKNWLLNFPYNRDGIRYIDVIRFNIQTITLCCWCFTAFHQHIASHWPVLEIDFSPRVVYALYIL